MSKHDLLHFIEEFCFVGVANPDSGIGVYAPDYESYSIFSALFDPIIDDYHKGFGPEDKHPDCDFGDGDSLVNLDPSGEYVISTRVRGARSLEVSHFSYPVFILFDPIIDYHKGFGTADILDVDPLKIKNFRMLRSKNFNMG